MNGQRTMGGRLGRAGGAPGAAVPGETETRRRSIGPGHRVASLALLMLVLACHEPAAPTGGVPAGEPVAVPDRPPASPDPLDPARLAEVLGGVRASADTTVSLEHAGRPLMLRDERRLDRTVAGDFRASVRRVHAGSEAGDTDERIEAARVGAGYWTRGSAGPWVAWDDAVDEPEAAAADALDATRDLLALVRQCGRIDGDAAVRAVSLRAEGCAVRPAPHGADWTGRVAALEGSLAWSGDLLVSADLRVRLHVAAGEGGGVATLEHAYRAEALLEADAPRAPDPAQTVPSRRERPVRMVRTVLEGWEDALGPGAPPAAGSTRR